MRCMLIDSPCPPNKSIDFSDLSHPVKHYHTTICTFPNFILTGVISIFVAQSYFIDELRAHAGHREYTCTTDM